MTFNYTLELRLSSSSLSPCPSSLSRSTSFWSIPFPSPTTQNTTSASPRIWSQHLSTSLQIPSIQTSQLWTPSRSLPLPSSTPQQPPLDFRRGPLTIERIPLTMQPSPSSNSIVSLPTGSLHLYKHPSSSNDSPTLALVSVPTLLNAPQILQFIHSHSPQFLQGPIKEMRILRDQNPSRSIVLIRFGEEGDKDKFRGEFEARKYWESKDVRLFFLSFFEWESTS